MKTLIDFFTLKDYNEEVEPRGDKLLYCHLYVYREQIAATRALYLEELNDKFYLTTEARLQLFGGQLESVKAELARRNLSDMPTHKLFEILIALHKALKEEAIEPHFMTEEEAEERKTERLARQELEKALSIW